MKKYWISDKDNANFGWLNGHQIAVDYMVTYPSHLGGDYAVTTKLKEYAINKYTEFSELVVPILDQFKLHNKSAEIGDPWFHDNTIEIPAQKNLLTTQFNGVTATKVTDETPKVDDKSSCLIL